MRCGLYRSIVSLLACLGLTAFGAAQAQNGDVPAAQSRPFAELIPTRIVLTVTGDAASPAFLSRKIAAAVADAARHALAPGGSVTVGSILPSPEVLGAGFLTSFRVALSVTPGPGAATLDGITTVDVQNAALPGFAPPILAFADDPERVNADGVLSRTTIDVRAPTRLYYYHENMRERRRFCVVLSVNDSVVTHVQTVSASAGPNIDVMSVGHAVTKSFLTEQPNNEGAVTTIWGGKPVLERDTTVGPGDGIVGSIDLRVLDGGPVTVTVMAIPIDARPATYLYAPKLPDDGHTRHGRFDLRGFAQRVIAFTAGGRDAAYVYGTRARTPENADAADDGHDYGDYGVLQSVTFDLDNPSAQPATVYLYEKPLGGVVRSSFLVDGSLVDVGCVRVAQRYEITSRTLAPHAPGSVEVRTMTDGGSNYPLEIGVSSTPPLASTPAITAADGCFPKSGGPPAAP
jgi:hypothetical protein